MKGFKMPLIFMFSLAMYGCGGGNTASTGTVSDTTKAPVIGDTKSKVSLMVSYGVPSQTVCTGNGLCGDGADANPVTSVLTSVTYASSVPNQITFTCSRADLKLKDSTQLKSLLNLLLKGDPYIYEGKDFMLDDPAYANLSLPKGTKVLAGKTETLLMDSKGNISITFEIGQ